MHLPLRTLLCQGVWNWPYFIQSESTAIENSVYCKLNKMHLVLSEHLNRYLTRRCLASGSKAERNIKDGGCERRKIRSFSPLFASCSAGLESHKCVRVSVCSPALHKAKTWHQSAPPWFIIIICQAGACWWSSDTRHPSWWRSSSVSNMDAPGEWARVQPPFSGSFKRIWAKLIFI